MPAPAYSGHIKRLKRKALYREGWLWQVKQLTKSVLYSITSPSPSSRFTTLDLIHCLAFGHCLYRYSHLFPLTWILSTTQAGVTTWTALEEALICCSFEAARRDATMWVTLDARKVCSTRPPAPHTMRTIYGCRRWSGRSQVGLGLSQIPWLRLVMEWLKGHE